MPETPDASPGSDEEPLRQRTRMTSAAKTSSLAICTEFPLRSRHGFLGRDFCQAMSRGFRVFGTRGRPTTSRRFRLLGLSGEPSSRLPTTTPSGVSILSTQGRKRIYRSASAWQILRCASDLKSPSDTTRCNVSTNESHFGMYTMSQSLPTLVGRWHPERTRAIQCVRLFGAVRQSSGAVLELLRSSTSQIRESLSFYARGLGTTKRVCRTCHDYHRADLLVDS
jgi:hypothetical protein